MEPLYNSGDSEPQSPWREIRNFSLQLLALGLALHSYVHWKFSVASNLFCEAKSPRELAISVSRRALWCYKHWPEHTQSLKTFSQKTSTHNHEMIMTSVGHDFLLCCGDSLGGSEGIQV